MNTRLALHRVAPIACLPLLLALGCGDNAAGAGASDESAARSPGSAGKASSDGSGSGSSGGDGADGFSNGIGDADAPAGAAGAGGSAGPAMAPTSGEPAGLATADSVPGTSVVSGPGSGSGIVSGTLTAGVWDDNGNFDHFLNYRTEFATLPGALPLTTEEHEAAHELFAQRTAKTTLDIALVIDTTGSMGDEMAYLQREFAAIASAIGDAYPNADARWALVTYRDAGDLYVTESHDFVDSESSFGETLDSQYADGGGDFPEAPDAAFADVNQLQWRSDADTARLVFWVADAPHHNNRAEDFAESLRTAQGQDVHVYPVASSGIDELTELTMRSAAQLTGGRYLFLTDDSGVGGAHKEPTIPCYFVTQLDHALLRMVDVELTGTYVGPEAAEVIRNGGNPQDGACELADGKLVNAF